MEIKFTKQALKDLEDMDNPQNFIDELEKSIEDGTFFTDSEEVDMQKLKLEEPDVYELLMQAIKEEDIKLN